MQLDGFYEGRKGLFMLCNCDGYCLSKKAVPCVVVVRDGIYYLLQNEHNGDTPRNHEEYVKRYGMKYSWRWYTPKAAVFISWDTCDGLPPEVSSKPGEELLLLV